MKKFIILMALFITGTCLQPTYIYAACPIESFGACKADISGGINTNIQNKTNPNNLQILIKPPNTMDMRPETTQPQLPTTINTETRPTQNPKGYDANCQFGDCMNKTPESEVSR